MSITQLTPLTFSPYDAIWFDYVSSAIINNDTQTLISFELPLASVGVIRWVGQDIATPNMESSVTWKILVNGGPDKVYGSIVGLISTIKSPTETMIKLTRGTKVIMQSSSTSSNVRVFGRLKGWHWIDKR